MTKKLFILTIFFVALLLYPVIIISGELEKKKVTIILLQDESLSMRENDPYGIRPIGAVEIADKLALAGPGNKLSLIIFGAIADERLPVFDVKHEKLLTQFKDQSRLGFSDSEEAHIKSLNSAYLVFEHVPRRMYTDIYSALKSAEEKLDSLELSGDKTEKHVVLFTDGKVYPWPGNDNRYGTLSTEYLEEAKGVEASNRYAVGDSSYCETAGNIDREAIRNEIIPRFANKGWRIHCVSFDPNNFDKDLFDEFKKTGGKVLYKGSDISKLVSAFDQIMPEPENLVRLFNVDFCREVRDGPIDWNVNVGSSSMDDLNLGVNFLKIYSREMPPLKSGDVEMVITDPNGKIYSSKNDDKLFDFIYNKKKEYLNGISFSTDAIEGNWNVLIKPTGSKDICGNVKVDITRNQQIIIEPTKDEFVEGSTEQFKVSLKNLDSKSLLPVAGVSGEIFSPLTSESYDLIFSSLPGQKVYTSDYTFDIKVGRYILKITVEDSELEEFSNQSKKQASFIRARDIRIKPLSPPTLTLDPDDELEFYLDADSKPSETKNLEINLSSEVQGKSYQLQIIKPDLEHGRKQIPPGWIEINPLNPTVITGNPYSVSVTMKILEGAILKDIEKKERYEGDLIIQSKHLEKEGKVKVKCEISFPRMVLKKNKMEYSFSWSPSQKLKDDFTIYHSSTKTRNATLTLATDIFDSAENLETGVEILFDKSLQGSNKNQIEIPVPPNEKVDVGIMSQLKKKTLDPEIRVKPGLYRTDVFVKLEGLDSKKIPVSIKIPKSYGIEKAGIVLKYGIFIFLGLGVLLWIIYLVKRDKMVFQNKAYDINFDSDNKATGPKGLNYKFIRKPVYKYDYKLTAAETSDKIYNSDYEKIPNEVKISGSGKYYIIEEEKNYTFKEEEENPYVLDDEGNKSNISDGFSIDSVVFSSELNEDLQTVWSCQPSNENLKVNGERVNQGDKVNITDGDTFTIYHNFRILNITKVGDTYLEGFFEDKKFKIENDDVPRDIPISTNTTDRTGYKFFFVEDSGNECLIDERNIFGDENFQFKGYEACEEIGTLAVLVIKSSYGKFSKIKFAGNLFLLLFVVSLSVQLVYLNPQINSLL